MSYDSTKANRDNSLYFQEKAAADLRQTELNEVNEEIEKRERSLQAAYSGIPDHLWRPAWSTSHIVVLVNILYTQRKILSKTVEKVMNQWPEREEFLSDVINQDIEDTQAYQSVKPLLEPYFSWEQEYPKTTDLKAWIEKDELMQFPFKDRVNKRKEKRGLK